MIKTKVEAPKSRPARADELASAAPTNQEPRADNTRETIESIIVALVLAFLFRAFEAEAFEIPTGSMGPTLLGRNKDVECPKCGFPFQAGVSFEVDDHGRPLYWDRESLPPGMQALIGQRVTAETCTCPNCRYTMSVDPAHNIDDLDRVTHPYSYSGDRIWVSKAPYVIADPQRWDVFVFKFPFEANINYIKRLVGLPNESVMIHRGNIYTSPLDRSNYTIARKPPRKVLATLLPVYDIAYELPELRQRGWPARWQPRSDTAEAGSPWKLEEDGKTFSIDRHSQKEAWLAYHHIPPDFEAWQIVQAGQLPGDYPIRPQLVSDFCGFNTGTSQVTAPAPELRSLGLHWVGDLSVSCDLDIQSDEGQVLLGLVEGGRMMHCEFDIASGQTRLSIDGLEEYKPAAASPLKGKGKHRVQFANVDDQLLVWVDGSLLDFSQDTAYPELNNQRPTVEDLTPVRVGARGATLRLEHLRIDRDIYYIAKARDPFCDYPRFPISPRNPTALADFLSTPERWDVFDHLISGEYPLEADQFLALGDNSPNSGDSRFWPGEHYVSRDLIIGKAFFVYWPHAWETSPSLPIPFRGRTIRVPFYPNFWEMRLIH